MKVQRLFVAVATSVGAYLGLKRLALRRRRFDFRGSSILIIGASRGLGLVLARALAREGGKVTLAARDDADLRRAVRLLEEEGADEPLAIPCDITVRSAVERLVTEVVGRRGRIDVLVNCAGVVQVGPVEHLAVDDFEQSMAVHFWGPLYAMLAVIPVMEQQRSGRIVNITSIGGKVAVPHLASYAASKSALTGLSDSMRAELSRRGIYVTTVRPGLMRTGSHINVLVKGRHREEYAWFALGASVPLLTMSAERAARRIVGAIRHGDRAIEVGLPARLLIIADAIAPSLVGEAMALANAALPVASGVEGYDLRTGWNSRSRWAPSVLTRRADREIAEHNELRGHRPEELRRGRRR